MQINDLSLMKNRSLTVIAPDASISNAAELLDVNNIGALPVCDPSGDLVGIISERDIVRGLSENGVSLLDMKVNELMTTDVITCAPSDDVRDIVAVMDEQRIRHIPVIVEGRLSAIVSSRDVMAAQLEETKSHCKTLGLAYEMAR